MIRFRAALVALCTLSAAACDSILDSETTFAERAEVTVTGSSPVPLRLIMSERFVATFSPEQNRWSVSLVRADTLNVTAFPVARSYDIKQYGVFFVRLANPDPDQTADVTMRVLIDGRERFNQRVLIRDASIEFLHHLGGF